VLGGRLVLDGSVYLIKWKNIQTNVDLPNCSYNFVDNLADATSKGFDVAFQLRVTDRFELSGAFGHNDPSFDRDAVSPGGITIYSKGGSIPDAGAPTTVSLSAEYRLPLGGARQGYARADYTRTSEWRRVGNTDPANPFYDPRLQPIPAYGQLNLRCGANIGAFDVSLFVQNVADAAPSLELYASTFYDPQDWTNVSLRPRTYGLTLTYRK
jgi:iron complex outermembrane recepter protein